MTPCYDHFEPVSLSFQTKVIDRSTPGLWGCITGAFKSAVVQPVIKKPVLDASAYQEDLQTPLHFKNPGENCF